MPLPTVFFAYLGPETVLPMTSVVATVVGVLMMCGRGTIRFLFRWRRSADADPARVTPSAPPKPHFRREHSPSAHEAERA